MKNECTILLNKIPFIFCFYSSDNCVLAFSARNHLELKNRTEYRRRNDHDSADDRCGKWEMVREKESKQMKTDLMVIARMGY